MTRPARGPRASRIYRASLALALVMSWVAGPAGAAPAAFAFDAAAPVAATVGADSALSAWDGSVNLYRTGVFSTQKTWYYCTAADVQIMRNIVFHEERHGRTAQDRYFAYMRDHLRYHIPVRQGVDPAGWTAGLRHFVDDRYRLVRSSTFGSLLRSAVRSLRRTNLPVALFVDRGNHGWVLHGFTATADPAVTSDFTVTNVRVSGPLWGRQNASYGYDMRPNKKLSRSQLKDFVTRWHYGPIRMVYEGEFLSIQPIGQALATAATETPGLEPPAVQPTPSPSPAQAMSTVAAFGPPSDPRPTPTPSGDEAASATPTPDPSLAASAAIDRPTGTGSGTAAGGLVLLLGVVALVVVGLRRARARPRRLNEPT